MTGTARGLRPLVGDVRRFGLLSATSVVDRYVDLVDRALGPAPTAHGPAAARGRQRPGPPPASPDLRLLAESTARMAQAYVDLLDAAATALTATGAAGSTQRDAPVVLPATAPGGSVHATLWLHNPTDRPVPEVTLTATPLVAGTGVAVPLLLDPPRLAVLPAGTSVPVRLAAVVPADQRAGAYHALVVASADPDHPVAVTLPVLLPEGRPG